MDRTEIVSALRAVPDEVEATVRGLSDGQVRRRDAEGGWSPIEVICHIRDSVIEEGLRAKRMLEEDNPTLEPYDQEERARERRYEDEDPRKALISLRAYVSGYAYQLEGLSDAEWARPGYHPEDGPVTVRRRAEMEVEHGRAHLEQLRQVREWVVG
jgi:hypothetical protein